MLGMKAKPKQENSMNIVLSTRNPSKADQIKAIFAGSPISLVTLNEVGIQGEAAEDGSTLQENALKKALFAHQGGSWAMADDTGIFINALQGAPGVQSARWAGQTATTEEITQYTLRSLEGKTDRSAAFETVVALISPAGERYFFSGRVEGKILETLRTKPQPKMPYSPIFVPDGTDKVWAEMSVEEENRISHRGKAFRQAREFLERLLH
jgi:XTP/dITP diphosphohydrolase